MAQICHSIRIIEPHSLQPRAAKKNWPTSTFTELDEPTLGYWAFCPVCTVAMSPCVD